MIVNYNKSILSYVSSIRKYFNLPSSYSPNLELSNLLNDKKPNKIIVLLVDGMGSNLINSKLSKDCFLRKNMLYETTTVFPSTTTAATTSIRNGKAPNENAWLGWTQYIKEIDDVIIPFYGCGFYNDIDYGKDLMYKTIPVTFTEDELRQNGINAKIVFPSFMQDGCEDFEEICSRIVEYANQDDNKYIYAYWDKYDSYMHKHGPSSKICDSYLEYINYEIENMSDNLPNDTFLIVTADHGQIDVKEEYNLYGSKYDKYFSMRPSLEPRAMTFFIKQGKQSEFEKEFNEEFKDRFELLTHQQVLDTHLFGELHNHPRFEEFIGDFLAIGKANTILAYKEEYIPSMKGQHAGINNDEMNVPIIVYYK